MRKSQPLHCSPHPLLAREGALPGQHPPSLQQLLPRQRQSQAPRFSGLGKRSLSAPPWEASCHGKVPLARRGVTQNVLEARLPGMGRPLSRLPQPLRLRLTRARMLPSPIIKGKAAGAPLEPPRKRSQAGAGLAFTASFLCPTQSRAAQHESHLPHVAAYTEPN